MTIIKMVSFWPFCKVFGQGCVFIFLIAERYFYFLQVNYVKRSSFDFVTHLEFSSLALQI